MRIKHENGFTLTELLVVLAIIGVLILIAIPTYASIQSRAKNITFDATTKNLHQCAQVHIANGGGDCVWSPASGEVARVATSANDSWMNWLEVWPDNPLGTGDFVVRIEDGNISITPGR